MKSLADKNIVLGITGGIAAYKSAELIRILKQNGTNIRVVMTKNACEFITPLTVQALSGNKAHFNLFDLDAEQSMGHIELARWADLLLIAPASADFIARLTVGRSEDLLSTLCLATLAPIYLAPAMNQVMWSNKATQCNVKTIVSRGINIIGPTKGEQACGDFGYGRMAEPEIITNSLANLFNSGPMLGKKLLITAGPTREKIDPVRYISNYSSGKMGFSLATAAAEAGAKVTLISGPVALNASLGVELINVESALDMQNAVLDTLNSEAYDFYISCAAVADYRPTEVYKQKIKKDYNNVTENRIIELTLNSDILSMVSNLQKNRPFVVGFAAETNNAINYAREKLQRKNLDMIIVNDVAKKNIGFGSDVNEVTVIDSKNEINLPQMSKINLGKKLIECIASSCNKKLQPK